MPPRVVGIILAGGLSSRMGQNKALLPYCGGPLIEHMASLFRDLHLPLYISGQLDSFDCIPDLVPHLGPIGGLVSAVAYLKPKEIAHALFVPVDMPLMTVDLLKNLLPHPSYDAIAYINKPLPLGLSLTPTVLQQLQILSLNPLKKNRSVQQLIQSLHTYYLSYEAKQDPCFQNINTPQDWHTLLEATS